MKPLHGLQPPTFCVDGPPKCLTTDMHLHRNQMPTSYAVLQRLFLMCVHGLQAESHDMVPAPTEAGDAVAKAEHVLEDLQRQASSNVRRHSRSFSEPNLAMRLQQPAASSGQVHARDSSEDEEDEDDTFAEEAEVHFLPIPVG